MPTEIITSLIAAAIGGLLVAVVDQLFARNRTAAETDKLRAEADKLKIESRKIAIETENLQAEADKLKVESRKIAIETENLQAEAEKLKAEAHGIAIAAKDTQAKWEDSTERAKQYFKMLQVMVENNLIDETDLGELRDEIFGEGPGIVE